MKNLHNLKKNILNYVPTYVSTVHWSKSLPFIQKVQLRIPFLNDLIFKIKMFG